MIERPVWYTVAAIGLISCLLYADNLMSEPLRLSRVGCQFYAQDAGEIAKARDAGIIEEIAQTSYAEKPYHAEVRPHLAALIHFIYASSLTPEEAERALLDECVRNKGWIGKDM